MVGTGKGAQAGILIRSAEALETAHKLDTIVLDKTGTITAGSPPSPTWRTDRRCSTGQELLRLAAAAERDSEHPLAARWSPGPPRSGLPLGDPADFESVTGQGIQATVDGQPCWSAARRLLTGQPASTRGVLDPDRRAAGPQPARRRSSSPWTAGLPACWPSPTPSRPTRPPPSPRSSGSASTSS